MAPEGWTSLFDAFSVDSFALAAQRADRAVVACGRGEPHQLHAWDPSTGELRRLTDQPRGVLSGSISPDGEWVYYLDDATGSEEGVLVRVPWAGGQPTIIDPELPSGVLLGLLLEGETIAFTMFVDGRCQHRIAALHTTGSRLLAEDDGFAFVGGLTADGTIVAVVRDVGFGRETHLLDVATGREVATLAAADERLVAYAFSPLDGDRRMLAESDASGYRRPFIWDPQTGAREAVDVGDLEGDLRGVAWAPDGSAVLLVQISRGRHRLFLSDLVGGGTRPVGPSTGTVTGLPVDFITAFSSPDELVTIWQSGSQPRSIISVPVAGGPYRVLLGDSPVGHEWTTVDFQSADGTQLQGWLATPDGSGPFPAVVDIHGGPGVAQLADFQPHLAAFVDQGFAVLTVNYRSSTSFGRAFEMATVGHPGDLEIEDIAAAREFLVRTGIADPDRVIVEGWSWGGYLSLLSLGRTPDLWAGGISGVGIGDMAAQQAEAIEYIASMIADHHGGTPGEVPERYVQSSPITYASAVTAPVLVIHGRHDSRCPAGQMERYLARMADLGKPVTAVWFDAGHLGPLADPSTARRLMRTMLGFAQACIRRTPSATPTDPAPTRRSALPARGRRRCGSRSAPRSRGGPPS